VEPKKEEGLLRALYERDVFFSFRSKLSPRKYFTLSDIHDVFLKLALLSSSEQWLSCCQFSNN